VVVAPAPARRSPPPLPHNRSPQDASTTAATVITVNQQHLIFVVCDLLSLSPYRAAARKFTGHSWSPSTNRRFQDH
jgi:hypothetical protein